MSLLLDVPTRVTYVVEELLTLPFYQDGNTYRSATHLLQDEFSPTQTQTFLEQCEENEDTETWYTIITQAIERLENFQTPKEEFDRWFLHQEVIGAMITYQKIIDELRSSITLMSFMTLRDDHITVEDDQLEIRYNRYSLEPYDIKEREPQDSSDDRKADVVLNRNNPFADVSIRDQQFLYAADHGRFNSLELNTSHTITRTQKNDEQSMIVIQPGFKIRNSPKLDAGYNSDISFDDTLTTEIAHNDDLSYVYIDAKDMISAG